MAGLDKILTSIKAESDEAVAKRIDEAKAQAEAMRKDAEASVKDECAQIEENGRRSADDTVSRAESAAALQKLAALPDDRYFDTIMKIAVKNALPEEGTIIFSAADRKRLPTGFEADLNKKLSGGRLKVSDDTINAAGGFVLSYGGIEQNCTFKALIDAEREKLTDGVSKVLFGGTEA